MIRQAGVKDEKVMYDLLCELEGVSLDRDRFHEAYMDYLNDEKMYCLIAQEYAGDGAKEGTEKSLEAVGVLNLRIGTMLCRVGKIGEIVELTVRSGRRSNGIGHALFKEAYRIAEENGCVRFEVSSNQTRTGAHRFYEREGMVRSHYRFICYIPRDNETNL